MKKQAIISGAAGGLGTAVTQAFFKDGYEVTALVEPGKPEQPKELKAAIGDSSRLKISALDVMDGKAVEAFFGEQEGAFQVAVFLVGGFAMGKLEATSEADLDKMIQLNFKTAFHCVKHALPKMAEGGRIILIGARPALEAEAAADLVAYSLSKGMVLQLAEIVNAVGAERNVQAVTVLPSIIDTPANREAMPDADPKDWVKPEEIAAAMLYACSPAGLKQRRPQFKLYGAA